MSCTVKRNFEALSDPITAPHHTQARMGAQERTLFGAPIKRGRPNLPSSSPPSSPPSSTSEASSPPRKTPFRQNIAPSPFHPERAFNLDNLERFLPQAKRLRQRESTADQEAIFTLPPAPPKSEREITFTAQQVREIVQKAVAEREQQLREEYDRVLKDKLSEQFENFSKFNQDYISRQMKESQWDYMI